MTTLVPAVSTGWSAGFGNLFAKELGSWWRTKRWLVHLVLWPVVILFIPLIVYFDGHRERTGAAGLAESLDIFMQVGAFFALVGAVLVTQSAVVGERHSGTAAWVLTKPTSRKAFILSKLIAITFSFLLLSLVGSSIVFWVQMGLTWKTLPNLVHFLEAIGLIALHQTFYIAMTLMLGTLFNSRGPVGGVAFGFWIAGNILPNFLPQWVALFMPWMLVQGAAKIAQWKPFPIPLWIPSVATAVWILLFVGVALWRFEREEF
jgi:ABC-2 type transport system permease protein